MLLSNEEITRYLSRIGISSQPALTVDALCAIQLAHLCCAPYENMDILNKKRLSMEPRALYNKIVMEHRGGYCFELNGAYGLLLRSLGYETADLFGRFLLNEQGIPMRRHRVLLVKAEGRRFLCDVGVGIPMPRSPIALVPDMEQQQSFGCYKLTRDAFLGWILHEKHKGEWRALYSFTEEPQLPVDFVSVSYFCENAPESIFNKDVMLAIRTLGGRITMDGMTLKFFNGESEYVSEHILTTDDEQKEAMRTYFGIIV